MDLLLLDNYDSFTWNLYQYLEELGATVRVELNDRVDCAWIRSQGFRGIIISPGPGRPESAGIGLELVREMGGVLPVLGVCLGHQTIAQAHGGRIVQAPSLMHGKVSTIVHDDSGVFRGLPRRFEATRYHSLVVDAESLGPEFVINARTEDGVVMGIRHRELDLHGVQFHPESVLTVEGKALLRNFLDMLREPSRAGDGS